MEVKERFIILRKTPYGESDLILQALSPKGEKVSFIARGALRSRKRFGGGILEPLHHVQLTYQRGAEGKLNVLKDGILLNDFPGLRKDYDRLTLSLKVLEIVGRVSQEGDSTSEFLFNLLGHALKALDGGGPLETLRLQFWLKFLKQQGVLTPEPWMTIFLETSLANSDQIRVQGTNESRRTAGLELLVEQYIKNATLT